MTGAPSPIDGRRIAADVATLAGLTEPDRPWTRRAFTPRFLDGRAYLRDRMTAAGLETRLDAAGNLYGRRHGRHPGRGAIVLGSHSDTVPDGGRFDGIAGVVAALEVARALGDAGIALDHDLEVVDWLAEEVSIFGVSCIGSRAAAGLFDPNWLGREARGRTLADGLRDVGGDPERIEDARRRDIRAFLELHIEQGPVLETTAHAIGIVSGIVGIARVEITISGRPDHAGTTPLGDRRDALVAAAELVTAVRALAECQAAGPDHFVATVGTFDVSPNAANVVPGRVTMMIDARAESGADMDGFLAALSTAVQATAVRHAVTIAPPRVVSRQPAVPCDARLRAVLGASADALGLTNRALASGAGHDAAWIAQTAPAAMLFIPCRAGRSHTPEEWADTDAMVQGAAVLLDAVRRIDAVGDAP